MIVGSIRPSYPIGWTACCLDPTRTFGTWRTLCIAIRSIPGQTHGWDTPRSSTTAAVTSAGRPTPRLAGAGERTGIDHAGPPILSSAGRRAGRGGKGTGMRGRWFSVPGSDRTSRQAHYGDMESGAGHAAPARARRPAGSRSGIPPPPSTAQGRSSIPPPVTALASCFSIPPPPPTAVASCSPMPPPPKTAP